MEIGKVISGSIEGGVKIILYPKTVIEDYAIGSLIIIEGSKYMYLGLITNSGLSVNQPMSRYIMNEDVSAFMKDILTKKMSGTLWDQWLEVALLAQTDNEKAWISDTMPNFSSIARELSGDEIKFFFGTENQVDTWYIGVPKTSRVTEVEIPINIEKLVNLSFGIFGKSGSGKTFLGNIIAGYMILYDLLDSNEKKLKLLIFDMHSEYALELKDNLGNPIEDGVGKVFKNWVKRYTPDEELARKRGLDSLEINITNLTISDLELIAPIFGISSAFIHYLREFRDIITKVIGSSKYWIIGILPFEKTFKILSSTPEGLKLLEKLSKGGINNANDLFKRIYEAIRENIGIGAEHAYKSQVAKLSRLIDYPIVLGRDSIDEIIDNLTRSDGNHVVISLGRYEKEMPLYMLIANLIARKLRNKILEKTLEGEELETKIVIFLEEAHNFLGKNTYKISPFGVIAREMRKKGVILCVIDQRPSELDEDVISMLWTNFVLSLTDRRDISTALIGAPKADLFTKIIPLLKTREVFIYGQAISFPVVIKIKDYSKVILFFKKKVKEIMSRIDNEVELLRREGLL